MKVTKSTLKQLIQEELSNLLKEGFPPIKHYEADTVTGHAAKKAEKDAKENTYDEDPPEQYKDDAGEWTSEYKRAHAEAKKNLSEKLTKTKLDQIIKEEYQALVAESNNIDRKP
tara:strand:+ start:222 stop:563 length:342 start_codon:yes stop_codon:yes gene_type:complete